MKTMQAREAKAKFSETLDSAESGEPVTITRHGRPVAMIVPMAKGREVYPEKPKLSFADHLRAFPGGIDLEFERDYTPIRDIDL